VDRLYSRFPGGSVGLALLLLRLVDGLGLVGEGIHLFTHAGSSLEPKSVLLLGLVLVASANPVDPRSANILGRQRCRHLHRRSGPVRQPSLKNARERDGCVVIPIRSRVFSYRVRFALLGPGGYSLDARLTGWRVIKLSSGQTVLQGRRLT